MRRSRANSNASRVRGMSPNPGVASPVPASSDRESIPSSLSHFPCSETPLCIRGCYSAVNHPTPPPRVPFVRKLLLRVGLPAAAAAVAILIVLSTASDGPDGERTATAARASANLARPVVDPEGRPAQTSRRPHVIMLILDEFPGDSLLGPDGRIDAVRWPNFAALAGNASWFPNAWSYYDSTPKAVPLIMDGKRPYKAQPADGRGHPRSLFDFFGRRGYRVRASEEATAICPRRWCSNARSRRPGILGNLNRGRVERLESFFRSIEPSRRPTFWLKHALLPHGPYMFLPSGAQTRRGAKDPVPGMNSPQGFGEEFLTRHNEQRYLLQLGFMDRQLGRLLDRLVRNGMFDNTMIVVVADHGYAFRTGVKDRRKVSSSNVEEVATVPLFVKAPGQRRGRVDRSYASTLDVAPTVADVLNARLPYRADGRSAFSSAVRRRRVVRLPTRDFSRTVRILAGPYERRRRAVVRRRLRMFGSGLTGLYSGIGPNRQLIGRAVSELNPAGQGSARASLVGASALRSVRRSSGLLPAQVAGQIRGGRGARRDIAVAVNGRIEAVARSFRLRGDRREHFALMVPEETLREGRNAVELFEVGRGRALRLLARV